MSDKASCFFCTRKADNPSDYQPCPSCKAKMGDSIPIFCVKEEKTGGLSAITSQDGKNLYPTGAYMAVAQHAIKEAFGISVEPGGQIRSEERRVGKECM